MEQSSDVIVVGGGIIGCAIGRELARRGAGVQIFEARSVGAGATQASAGVLAPYIEAHERGPLFDLAVRSLQLYDDFVSATAADSGIQIEYARCGTLEVALDETQAARLRQSARQNPGDLRWLEPGEARGREPALPDAMAGALLAAAHGYVAVPPLVEALAWAALRHGAELETGRRIASIGPHSEGLKVTAEDGSSWTAGHVVLATGSWSGLLETGDTVAAAVRPVRGQLLRLGWNGRLVSHVLWGPDCYVVPWQDGTVLVGATVEEVGFDERTTAAGVRDLLDAVCELLPEAWGATFLGARAGLRPATADGLPFIGRSPSIERLVYATGHYRNGILLAPLTATLVADLILEGKEDPALDATRPDRIR